MVADERNLARRPRLVLGGVAGGDAAGGAADGRGMMRVLVACEYSGRVRDSFIALGHDAMSCDLLPTDAEGPHYQGNVFDILNDGWDLMVGHPPCTYLTNSGVRWLYNPDGSRHEDRWTELRQAADFFNALLTAPIARIALENPLMHRHARTMIPARYTQIIQPWQFGHGETKATCLWLKNLPKLRATETVTGRVPRIHHLPPSANRWKLRSETYEGIARAMAEQWGGLDPETRPTMQTEMFAHALLLTPSAS